MNGIQNILRIIHGCLEIPALFRVLFETRGAVERLRYDKRDRSSALNDFKYDPFCTHLVSLFAKKM